MAIRETPPTPVIDSIKNTFLKKYTCFTGRARRSEFWYFQLICVALVIIIMALVAILGNILGLLISSILGLALFLPNLAVSVRRLHDINKSGWFLLIGLIPVVGIFVLLVWFCTDSDPLPNQYGQSPKYIDVE